MRFDNTRSSGVFVLHQVVFIDAHLSDLLCPYTAWTSDPVEAVAVRAAQDQYVQRTIARWRSARIDLLLLPGFACPPPPRDKIAELLGMLQSARFLRAPDIIGLPFIPTLVNS